MGLNSQIGEKVEKPSCPNEPGEAGEDAVAIRRLAALSRFEYDRVRQEEAERLEVRVSTLDEAVRKVRSEAEEATEPGMVLNDPEPWVDPVDGAALLDEIVATIRRHVILPEGAPEATALWLLHAHAHDAARISPVLAVTSPTPECGKTTLLTLLGALAPKPLPASNITAAALFRAVEKWRPCVLIDEADTFLRDSDELRGVLNSGHNRAGAYVIRTVGEDHEPKAFRTWAPKAIALIGTLPPTLASRSIHIELRRMGAGEHVAPLRADRLSHLEPLQRKAWRWAQDHLNDLRAADPELPTGLRGRAVDNWRPLLAIADAAGGGWPQRARAVAEAMEGRRREETAGIVLLGDIRDLFAARGDEKLKSHDVVAALVEIEDRPWPEWKRDKPLTARQLASLLKPFGIEPRKFRSGDKTHQGYLKEDFGDAFRRYLSRPIRNTGTNEQDQ